MFIQEAIDILCNLDINIKDIVNNLKEVKWDSGIIFTCGNGGSAATASHFTSDLMAKGIYSTCLNDNTSIITATANDYDYDEIFSSQLRKWDIDMFDLLVVFSCSGNSRNVLEAIKVAREKLASVIIFTSNGGGLSTELFENIYVIDIPTDNIYLAEGIHSLLTHAIVDEL